ncbi:mannose-1-phosphate guanylyltransferase [Mytilus galloprovincialis]|uniref:Mannose-1-phosphate guanylyltransferase n=1 Tax=Mytilus galloprovincialis TaxID=29158 RepID=A0A8B6FVX6_MYTGA|nr:mannose-1-phosphate guanylyltransferase [Mytilus galloprovincialis]
MDECPSPVKCASPPMKRGRMFINWQRCLICQNITQETLSMTTDRGFTTLMNAHGPNVSIGKYANIGEGVRVRESIVLEGTTLQVAEGVRFQESIVLEGATLKVAEGVRVRESIVLEGAPLQDHSCVLYSIIGWNAVVGSWTRVEGTPNGPNPKNHLPK